MTTEYLDDQTFLKQFESLTLEPCHFNHIGHLRLAWLYLQSNDVSQAAKLTSNGIKAYAESLGANNKFHLTITNALYQLK